MHDYDSLLQECLEKLENGAPLSLVLENLQGEAQNLAALIQLAAAVREVPHPEPGAAAVQLQRRQIAAAAIAQTTPLRRPAPRRQPIWGWLMGARVFAGAGALAVLALVVFMAVSFWQNNRTVDVAWLDQASGQVELALDADGAAWQALEAGDRLTSGQRIRTAGASVARLRFYEGTTVYLLPDSEMTFATLTGSRDTLQVEIIQHRGESRHKVTPLQGSGSYFLVRTPSGTASVHGTSFNVRVGPEGQSQFAVTEGEVRVRNELEEVVLLAGQTTFAGLEGTIAEPGYLFGVQGSLLSIDDETGHWDVSGMIFTTGLHTVVIGSPQLGEMVIVSGRVLEGGLYLADTIAVTDSNEQTGFFSGQIESMNGQFWQVGQNNITVVEDTDIAGEVAVGSLVKVTVNILEDGTWLALRVENVQDESLDPTPTQPEPVATAEATATATETPTSSPSAVAGESETPDSVEPTATPAPSQAEAAQKQEGTCTGANPHPTGVKLAQRYNVSYTEIMDWFCDHRLGFGEIDLGYRLAHTGEIPVEEVFAMRASGQGWGEIKKQIQDKGEKNRGAGKGKDKDKKDKKDR